MLRPKSFVSAPVQLYLVQVVQRENDLDQEVLVSEFEGRLKEWRLKE